MKIRPISSCNLCCHYWWGRLPLYAEWNRGERRSVKRQVYGRMLRGDQNKNIRYIEVHSLSRVWNIIRKCLLWILHPFSIKEKACSPQTIWCGGTSVRRHGKEDAQVTERRSGLPCSCSKNVGLATALFENGFARQRGWTCLKKVQMKRSVTGGEDWTAAHKGKALVLRWLGARQRLYR